MNEDQVISTPDALSPEVLYIPWKIAQFFAQLLFGEEGRMPTPENILTLRKSYEQAKKKGMVVYDCNHNNWGFPLDEKLQSTNCYPLRACIARNNSNSNGLPWVLTFIGEDHYRATASKGEVSIADQLPKSRGSKQTSSNSFPVEKLDISDVEDGVGDMSVLVKNLTAAIELAKNRGGETLGDGWVLLADVGLLYCTVGTGNKLNIDVVSCSSGRYKNISEYCRQEKTPFELAYNHLGARIIRIRKTEAFEQSTSNAVSKKKKNISLQKSTSPDENKEVSFAFLHRYIKEYYIFIDACSFQYESFPLFLERLHPLLVQEGRSVYTLSSVEGELKNNAKKKDMGCASSANRALQNISLLKKTGSLRVVDSSQQQLPTDTGNISNFADPCFLNLVRTRKSRDSLLIITQDTGLANDLLNTNNEESMRGKTVRVLKIKKGGSLEDWGNEEKIIPEMEMIAWNEPLE